MGYLQRKPRDRGREINIGSHRQTWLPGDESVFTCIQIRWKLNYSLIMYCPEHNEIMRLCWEITQIYYPKNNEKLTHKLPPETCWNATITFITRQNNRGTTIAKKFSAHKILPLLIIPPSVWVSQNKNYPTVSLKIVSERVQFSGNARIPVTLQL